LSVKEELISHDSMNEQLRLDRIYTTYVHKKRGEYVSGNPVNKGMMLLTSLIPRMNFLQHSVEKYDRISCVRAESIGEIFQAVYE